MLCSECGAAAESKEEDIRGTKWRPAGRRTGGRAKRIKTRKVKQEDVSNIGTGFHLGERGVRDECGQVLIAVREREEVVDREIRCSIGGEENVGYIV